MKVIMVMVTTLNGKITRGDNPDVSAFASKEDAALFHALKEHNRCYIMGAETFEASRTKIMLRKGKLRVVMTHTPDKYKAEAVPGRLEFTSAAPGELLERLQKRGHRRVLLLGGATMNRIFLEAGLVDEIWVTVEPFVFGKGRNLVVGGAVEVSLRLISIERLNKAGTLHIRYKVLK